MRASEAWSLLVPRGFASSQVGWRVGGTLASGSAEMVHLRRSAVPAAPTTHWSQTPKPRSCLARPLGRLTLAFASRKEKVEKG